MRSSCSCHKVSKICERIYSSTHTNRFLYRFDDCSRLHQQRCTQILKVHYQLCHVYSQPHRCTTVEIRQHERQSGRYCHNRSYTEDTQQLNLVHWTSCSLSVQFEYSTHGYRCRHSLAGRNKNLNVENYQDAVWYS